MRSKFAVVLLTLGLAVGNLVSQPAVAQLGPTSAWANGQDVGAYVSGDQPSTSVPILIRYIGNSPQGGTVTVESTGDITLKTGPVGSSTADLTTECPVSGALGGVIDVSDAACNTMGEVVDAINASPNWRAVIQDGLRSDASDNVLYDKSEIAAAGPAGVTLFSDSRTPDYLSVALTPVRNDISFYLQESGPSNAGVATNPRAGLNSNPFNDSRTFFRYAGVYLDGAGAGANTLYSVLGVYKRPTLAVASTAASIISTSTETVTTLFAGVNAGDVTFGSVTLFTDMGLGGRRGEKLVFRAADASALSGSTSYVSANGRYEKQ